MADLDLAGGLESLRRRTRWATYSIWAYIVATALAVLGQFLEFTGAVDFEAFELDGLTALFGIVYLLDFIAFISTILLVAPWLRRAHGNLFAAGIQHLDYTPGWSVGWYFVPIANLYKPFEAMRELWNASHGARDTFTAPAPAILVAWWAAWIVCNIVDTVCLQMAWRGGPEVIRYSYAVGALGSALSVVAAAYLLQIIGRVNAVQTEGLR